MDNKGDCFPFRVGKCRSGVLDFKLKFGAWLMLLVSK